MASDHGSPLGAGTQHGDRTPASADHPWHGSYETTGQNPTNWLPGQYQHRIYEPNQHAAYAWSAQQQNYANHAYSPYNPNQQYTSPYTQYFL